MIDVTRFKGAGTTAALYSAFIEEAEGWQPFNAAPSVLWGTTASPTVFFAVQRYLGQTEPHTDGTYTPRGL